MYGEFILRLFNVRVFILNLLFYYSSVFVNNNRQKNILKNRRVSPLVRF